VVNLAGRTATQKFVVLAEVEEGRDELPQLFFFVEFERFCPKLGHMGGG
jgi:hypothetical protein